MTFRMQRFTTYTAAVVMIAAATAWGCSGGTPPGSAAPAATPTPGATPGAAAQASGAPTAGSQIPGARRGGGPVRPVMPDSIANLNARYVAEITASIAGRENLPADQVFKDVQLLKNQSAARLLAIMNAGYSRALGVSCEHCHDPAAWESNAKEDKKTARGMIRMVDMINAGNRTIPEFADNNVVINCTVCHQGSVRPVRNLPAPGAAPRGGASPAGVR